MFEDSFDRFVRLLVLRYAPRLPVGTAGRDDEVADDFIAVTPLKSGHTGFSGSVAVFESSNLVSLFNLKHPFGAGQLVQVDFPFFLFLN
jgi:hypothetical protein